MQSSGVSSSNVVPVTTCKYPVCSFAERRFFLLPSPAFIIGVGLTITGIAWAWKQKMVSDQCLSCVSTPVVSPPLVRTFPVKHLPLLSHPLQSGLGLVTLLSDERYPYHTSSLSHLLSSGRVCSHSIATDVPLAHLLNITPPAVGLLCMVLITGGTLDTTAPYKSTPGDAFFKGHKVITGVCVYPCYTILVSTRQRNPRLLLFWFLLGVRY